jgi:acetyltransferase-like isoleucine patch superfamily enzyme
MTRMEANSLPGCWVNGTVPDNVALGTGTVVTGELAFKRFHAHHAGALSVGPHCTMDGVHFNLGEHGTARVGSHCCFTNVVLLCELEISIGSYVVIGWNSTLADTDFHPLEPAARIADAIACSPLGKGTKRPPIAAERIVIEDDVWIGANATILKGVRIGRGAWIEPGALVTRDVPPRSRVAGNPAQIIGAV